MGPLTFGQEEGEVFLGRTMTQTKEFSDQTAQSIDQEVRKIIDRNFQHAESILKKNVTILHLMADALMKYETIDAAQIKVILTGVEPPQPEGWDDIGKNGPSSTEQGPASTAAKPKTKKKVLKGDNPASETQQ
jgi:cell division protease FtsH